MNRALLCLLLALGGCAASGQLGGPPVSDDDAGDDDDAVDDDDLADDDDATPVATLLVNEIAADNAGSVLDDQGEASDWLELYNPGAQAVNLGGYTVSDDWTEPAQHALPAGLVVPANGHLLLWADGDPDPEDAHLPFRLAAAGEAVGIFAPDGALLDWVEFPPMAPDAAWARLPDGGEAWAEVSRGTPGAPNSAIEEEQVPLVEAGASWRYLDTGVDPGVDWALGSFDDASWAEGAAPLGYGDPMSTEVGYGPDAGNKHITTWFRHAFSVSGALAEGAFGLELGVRADDGAVVWLNGVELTRVRMPSGPITAETLSSATVGGGEETAFGIYALGAEALLPGPNQLAVEVHQGSTSSSDIAFDLSLDAQVFTEITP